MISVRHFVARLVRLRLRTSFFILLLALSRNAVAQCLDLNHNGISDIWELMVGAQSCDPNQDPDGDGLSNLQEAIAGTNPFDARSLPKIDSFKTSSNRVVLSMSGALGKLYKLQASETLCGSAVTNWYDEASLVLRTNTMVVFNALADRPNKFFRILVFDIDSDGDGLNDWEEYQLGLDPLSAYSNGQKDSQGNSMTDYAYAVNWLNLAAGNPKAQSAQAPSGAASRLSLTLYPDAAPVGGGSGLTGEYFTNSSATYSNWANFNPTNLFLTTNDAAIDFRWGPATTPNLSNGFYTVRWTGQVVPQYSETYVFETRSDDGAKLWVNDQLLIDHWQAQGVTSWTNVIRLTSGVRYNLRMEYFNRGGSARAQLYWYSPSQLRQIIPTSQLYPASGGLDPGGVTSDLSAIAFLGQPFAYTITAANSPMGFGVTNLPPGLDLNSTNGVISGIPTLAGGFDVSISVTNSIGVAAAVLHLEVIDTGSAVTREVWQGVRGSSITNIPLQLPASITNTLGSLEGLTNFGDNYAERVRGYLTAPVTGNYYFWIAAKDAAELWISNDAEPANKVRRATVKRGTAPRQWSLQPNQRSGWLSLVAGNRYYIEILHKAGVGSNDHWSVGWLQDPSGTNTVPAGVVPGYVLSPYVDTPAALIPGTLYSANMVAQSGAASSGVGSATLRLSADGTQAVLKFNYSGLSSPLTAEHIHVDTYLGKNPQGQIVFDIDAATPEADGSYIWTIAPSGSLSAADITEIIKEGKSYINVHTVNYPDGEINGHFSATAGSPTFTSPPPSPKWLDDHGNSNAAARFLSQATFGPNAASINSVKTLGYAGWIGQQFKVPVSSHLANLYAVAGKNPDSYYPGTLTFNTWWQRSVTAPDQLRQRVAFALSEIMVVSENGALSDNGRALSSYYDILLTNAFGNYRELLQEVTLSPAMGIYLNMQRNDKANPVTGTHPNENYAREILQLFSIGLNRVWPDGTLVLNSAGDLVPTYDQDVVQGFARVFTGWNYYQTNQANKRLPVNWNPNPDYIRPMVLVPTHHELGTKRVLDNVILPPAQGSQANAASNSFDLYCSQDLQLALDSIFNNENVGPFICRQLIQRLVTSQPSRDYLYRVVQKFNDNGSGVRGDMKAVIKAILLDYEARSPAMLASPTFGKQREPVLRATAIARALPAPAKLSGTYTQTGSQAVTVTTSRPHRLSSSDDVYLQFGGNPAPGSQIYYNVKVTGPKSFTINPPGVSGGTYSQTETIITVTNSGHGLSSGYQIYLSFSSGGASKGVYTVASVLSSSVFTVVSATSGTHSGNCVFPNWTGGSFTQSGSNITLTTTAPHGLNPGARVFIAFPNGSASSNGVYRVAKVPRPTQLTVISGIVANDNNSLPALLPLAPAPVVRSGNVTLQYSTWGMNYTDTGYNSALGQTPLNSPTVFNFFFPDYKYQGILASAGISTPEFQLTSDTTVVFQMNFVSSSIFNNGSNTNGLSSFAGGSGAIAIDLGPWMTPAKTSDAAIPALVDTLSSQLCEGELSPSVKSIIVSYVANPRFPYSTPTPTFTQMRDRVRAVVHLITASPDFSIQR